MTIDDENSIYVGGLPYNATDDSIRQAFRPYGSIMAVKIVNDRATRGKCYGFVTFKSSVSVMNAISNMDRKIIDGRTVRVNEVTTRGGKSNLYQEHLGRIGVRGMDSDRDRVGKMDYDHDRERQRYHERHSDRSNERNWSWERNGDKEKEYDHEHDLLDQDRDELFGDGSHDRYVADDDQEQVRSGDCKWDMDSDLEWDRDGQMDGSNGSCKFVDDDREQPLRKQNSSLCDEQHSRETSSDSSSDNIDVGKEQLVRSIQRREELKKEISQMEERLEDKQRLILDLQKDASTLEDALVIAKKLSLQRKMQLTKLHKCFLQERDFSERVLTAEHELKSLIDSADMDWEIGEDNAKRIES